MLTSLPAIFMAIITGWLMERISFKKLINIFLSLLAISIICLIYSILCVSHTLFIIALVMFSLTITPLLSIVMSVSLASVHPEREAYVSGMINQSRQIGGSIILALITGITYYQSGTNVMVPIKFSLSLIPILALIIFCLILVNIFLKERPTAILKEAKSYTVVQ